METLVGRCHCGAVEFEVDLENGLGEIRRCNCSICRRKGAVVAMVPLERLRVVKGEDNLTLYRWNMRIAKHYFCKTCGIYTHHQRRSDPTKYAFNVACVEGIDPFSFPNVPVGDGASLSVAE